MCEEIWENLGHNQSIFLQTWPKFDKTKIVEDQVEIPVQVNGKVRDKIMVSTELSEDQIKEIALKSDKF